MTIIAVDDEKLALEALRDAIKEAEPTAQVFQFRSGVTALDFARKSECGIAFLDIQMNGMSGISLAKCLKINNPKVNIIFTTGYSDYTGDAIRLRASGYVMKPVTAEKIREEIDNLRYPVECSETSLMQIRAFGNFEVFAGGKPIQFKYTKAKELLAYLVDRRGALCSNEEIICTLWENTENPKEKMSYFKSVRRDLLKSLKAHGYDEIIIQQRGLIGIDAKKVKCDYFDWANGSADGINAYHGEYMRQYSWAEITSGQEP